MDYRLFMNHDWKQYEGGSASTVYEGGIKEKTTISGSIYDDLMGWWKIYSMGLLLWKCKRAYFDPW